MIQLVFRKQPYPIHNRPRGQSDISSVKTYQKQIQNEQELSPIWLFEKNRKYTLLDGHPSLSRKLHGRQQNNQRFCGSFILIQL